MSESAFEDWLGEWVGTSMELTVAESRIARAAWKAALETRTMCKCEERRNMLEDVVNELDLSDGTIDEHGPLGTAPATLVRLVLDRKDQTIARLKAGMVEIRS
jgi:hypothetical protein